MRFKILSFDVEGTMISHRFSEIVWEEAIPRLYSKKKNIGIDDAKSYVMSEYEKIGEERMEWYDIEYWFNRFGLIDHEKLLQQNSHEIFIYPETRQILNFLSKSYRLIIISNSAREFLELEIDKIKKHFFRIFSAPSDFKQIKKATNVYQEICRILKVEPTELIHIGDHWNYDYIVPRKIGISSFYIDRKGEKQGEFIVHNLGQFRRRIKELENKH